MEAFSWSLRHTSRYDRLRDESGVADLIGEGTRVVDGGVGRRALAERAPRTRRGAGVDIVRMCILM